MSVEHSSFLSPEAEPSFSGLRFEAGLHSRTRYDLDELTQLIVKGRHTWNEDAAVRIGSYDPEILGIDGDAPQGFNYLNPQLGFGLEDKIADWYSLPASPGDINSQGAFDLVRGDLQYSQLIDFPVTWQGSDDVLEIRQRNSLMTDLVVLQEGYDPELDRLENFEILARFFGGLGAYGLFEYMTRDRSEKVPEVEKQVPERKISRRTLMRGMAGLVCATPTVALIASTYGVSHAETERWGNISQDVLTIVRPRFAVSKWVDARTALVIAKTQDAFDVLGKPSDTPAAVLMGSSHAAVGEILRGSQAARTKVIRSFAGELLIDIDELLSQYPLIDKGAARINLLENIAKVDIVHITDPGVPTTHPQFLSLLDSSMDITHTFQSPQVEEALKVFTR